MKRFKKTALSVSACTLALTGLGVMGATTASAIEDPGGGGGYVGTYDLPTCEYVGGQITGGNDYNFDCVDAGYVSDGEEMYDLYA